MREGRRVVVSEEIGMKLYKGKERKKGEIERGLARKQQKRG